MFFYAPTDIGKTMSERAIDAFDKFWDRMWAEEKASHDIGGCDTTICLYCEGEKEREQIARSTVIRFGQHAGKRLGDMPPSYWAWAAGQKSRDDGFKRFQVEAKILVAAREKRLPKKNKATKTRKPAAKTRQKSGKLTPLQQRMRRVKHQMKRDKAYHAERC